VGLGAQVGGERGGAGQVGVGGGQGECDGGHRGDDRAGRTDGDAQQVGQWHRGTGRSAEHRDRRGGQPEVDQRGHQERDGHDPGQLAGGLAQAGGQRGDGLPADERQHQHRRGTAERGPAVRQERRPVGEPGGVSRAEHRHHDKPDQHRDQHQLRGHGGPGAAEGQPDHHGEQHRAGRHPDRPAAAQQYPDVAATDQADHRRTAHHGDQEAPADRPPGRGAQARRRVPRHPTAARQPGTERGEQHREQPGHRQQAEPGQDRSRAGQLGGQAGQQQQAGSEQRPDVQRGASRGGKLRCSLRCSLRC